MSYERAMVGIAAGAEAAPSPVPAERQQGTPQSLRIQILSTEHWGLLSSRSLAWNESFSRAGMFLSTLSGAIVALALVAQAAAFGDGFTLFALIILPAVLFVGISTYLRLGVSNYHDAMCVIGMNRIRAAYLEVAPDLERFFVMSAHDDARGVGISMGVPYSAGLPLVHLVAATPMVVTVLNGLVGGAIVAVIAVRSAVPTPGVVALGVAGFLAVISAHVWDARRNIARVQAGYKGLFPSPDTK